MKLIWILFSILLCFPLVIAVDDCLDDEGKAIPCPQDAFDPSKMSVSQLQNVDAATLIANWNLLAAKPALQAELTSNQLREILRNPEIQLDLAAFEDEKITSLLQSTYNFKTLTGFTQAKGTSVSVKNGVISSNGKTFNVEAAAASLKGNTALNVLSDGTVQVISQSAQIISPDTLAGAGATYEIVAGKGGEKTALKSGDGTFFLKEGSLQYKNNQLMVEKAVTIILTNGKEVYIRPKSTVSLNGKMPNNINIKNDNLEITSGSTGFELAYRTATEQLLPYVLKGTSKITIENVGQISEVVDLHSNSDSIRLGHLIIDENGRILRPTDFNEFVAPAMTKVRNNGRLPYSQEYTWNGKAGEGRIFQGDLDLTFPIAATQAQIAELLSKKLSHLTPSQLEKLGINIGKSFQNQGRSRAGSRAQDVIDYAKSLVKRGIKTEGAHCTAAVFDILFPGSNLKNENHEGYSIPRQYESGGRHGSGVGKYHSSYADNGKIGNNQADPNIVVPGTHVMITTPNSRSDKQGSHSGLVTEVLSSRQITYGGKTYMEWDVITIGAFNGRGATRNTFAERKRTITTAPITSNNVHNGANVLLRSQQVDTTSKTYLTSPSVSEPTQAQYLAAANSFLKAEYSVPNVASDNPYITQTPPRTDYASDEDYYYASLAADLESTYDEYDLFNSQYAREETEVITYTMNAADIIETGFSTETKFVDLIGSVESGRKIIISKNNVRSAAQVESIESAELLNVNGKKILVYPATITTHAGKEVTVYLTDSTVDLGRSNLEFELVNYEGTVVA